MKPIVKKTLKIAAWSFGGLFALIALALLVHPLWLGPTAAAIASKVVESKTGSKLTIDSMSVNLYSGHIALHGARLYNPEGFEDPIAIDLGSLTVDLDVGSVLTDTIDVKDIMVRDVFVAYVEEHDKVNFDVIAENASASAEPEPTAASVSAPAEPVAEEAGGKKVIIDKLTITGVKIKYLKVTLSVPVDVVLKDIGRESGGIDFATLRDQVIASVLKSAGCVGESIDKLSGDLKNLSSGLKDLSADGISKTIDNIGNVKVSAKGVSDSVKGAADSVKGVASDLKSLFKKDKKDRKKK